MRRIRSRFAWTGSGWPIHSSAARQRKQSRREAPKKNSLHDADEALQVRVPVKAGLRQVTATIFKAEDAEAGGRGARSHSASGAASPTSLPNPASISSLLVGGPYKGEVPQDSPSRRLIFTCHPANAAEETPCATKILSKLARRAYRRAGDQRRRANAARLLPECPRRTGISTRGFAPRSSGYWSAPIFCSASKPIPPTSQPGEVYRISDVELASRLSFALWSSIPDDRCSTWRSTES